MKKKPALIVIAFIIMLVPISAAAFPEYLPGDEAAIIFENDGILRTFLCVNSVCFANNKLYFLTENALFSMHFDSLQITTVFAFYSSISQRELSSDELILAEKYPHLNQIVADNEGNVYGFNGNSWYLLIEEKEAYCISIEYSDMFFSNAKHNSQSIKLQKLIKTSELNAFDTHQLERDAFETLGHMSQDAASYVLGESDCVFYFSTADGAIIRLDTKSGDKKAVCHLPLVAEDETVELQYVDETRIVAYNWRYIMVLTFHEPISFENRIYIEYSEHLTPALYAVCIPSLQVVLTSREEAFDIKYSSTKEESLESIKRKNLLIHEDINSSCYDPKISSIISYEKGVALLPLNIHCSVWEVSSNSPAVACMKPFCTYHEMIEELHKDGHIHTVFGGNLFTSEQLLILDYLYQCGVQGYKPTEHIIKLFSDSFSDNQEILTDYNKESFFKPVWDFSAYTALNYLTICAPLPIDSAHAPRINAWIDFAYVDADSPNKDQAKKLFAVAFENQTDGLRFLLDPFNRTSPILSADAESQRMLAKARLFLLKTRDVFDSSNNDTYAFYLSNALDRGYNIEKHLLSKDAEREYREMFGAFDFSRAHDINPDIVDAMLFNVDEAIEGSISMLELFRKYQ